MDPARRRVFIPARESAPETAKTDWALAAGPVGSFAWAEARMEGKFPLGEGLDEGERAIFAQRVEADRLRGKQQLPDRPQSENGAFVGIDDDGRVYRLDDSVRCTPIDETPEVARVVQARAEFERVCDDETGLVVDADRKRRKDAERAALLAQTHRIAGKLQLAGVPAYLSTEWTIATVGVHTGEVHEMPKFRRKTFLPYVAAQLREPHIRALEYWLQDDPFSRFWTLTTGERVPLRVGDFAKNKPALRRAIRRLHARINDLNAADFMQEAGVRIVWRSTELGSVERKRKKQEANGARWVELLDEQGEPSGRIERDAAGAIWFHPHAHCLVHMEKGRLPYAEWSAFLARVGAFWGAWWDDGGVIRKSREAVKYITKPGEIERLSPDELAELDRQLSRLHMVQPLGKLAEQIRARDEAGKTLLPEQTKDGRVWREALDVNRRGKASKEKQRVRYAERDEHGCTIFEGKLSESEFAEEAKRQSGAEGVDSCVVVAQVAPGAAQNCVKEPRVVVMFKRFDAARVANHPLVQRLREVTADAWQAGCALAAAGPIRVHTGTSTVRETVPAAQPRPPRPASGVFRAHLERLETLAQR